MYLSIIIIIIIITTTTIIIIINIIIIKHVFSEKQEVDDLVQWHFPFKWFIKSTLL